MIAHLRQRLDDVLRERRIADLKRQTIDARNLGNFNMARALLGRMQREIADRSPQQIERMERAKGLRHA